MTVATEILWTAGFLNERFPAPVSPMGWSVVGPLFEEYALRDPLRFMGYPEAERVPATRLVHGHPYANVLIFQILYSPFPDSLLPADAMRYFPGGAVNERKSAPYPRSILNTRFLLSMVVHCLQDPINWSPFNFWQWSRYTRFHDERIAKLDARLDTVPDSVEIFQIIAGARQVDADLLKIHRWSLTYADLFFKWLCRLSGDSAQLLIADVPNLTVQVNQDLDALVGLASNLGLKLDSEEGIADARSNREFDRALGQFQARHGHRSFSLDIGEPTFRDDPSMFLKLSTVPPSPGRTPTEGQREREFARMRLPLHERPLFDVLLAFARRYAALREDQRYYWHKSLAVSRRAYLMLGSRLHGQDLFASPDDIFYATASEVATFFQGRLPGQELAQLVQERQRDWRRYRAEFIASPSLAYPAFLLGDTPFETGISSSTDNWQGRGISPGLARGIVRVILDARDLFRVKAGEILVAPSTDPAWTPVFSRLAALVVERGGVLAHSAIVAREHQLPAVAGISNITRELADGDWIEVDGTSGIVRRIDA